MADSAETAPIRILIVDDHPIVRDGIRGIFAGDGEFDVVAEAGKGTAPDLFDVVTVTGTMSVNRIDNEIAEAGYTLYATDIVPYE